MKALKVTGIIIGIIALCVGGVGVYLSKALPDAEPAPEMQIERTAERIERGNYLAHHVAVCMDCHSTRDWSLYSGPISGPAIGGGGEGFRKEAGFPGDIFAPNITPYALSNWTDGEIFRAITTGVDKDGNALFPLMAYHRFGKMDKGDIESIIAYMRTLPPVKNDVPSSSLDFPLNLLVNTMPQQASFTQMPDRSNTVAYGAYLVNVAGCVDCHSQVDKGKVIEGTEFGGGMEFRQPAGVLVSPNITFDTNTGIGSWSKELFVSRFHQYSDSSYRPVAVTADQLNTPMPWTMYAGMSKEDLSAIYDFLKSIPPVNNK